jgi:hypothetical protein
VLEVYGFFEHNSSVTSETRSPPTHFVSRLRQGIPAILLLGSWLVLFEGAAQGGWFLGGAALGLAILLWRSAGGVLLGTGIAFLTASLMVFQPSSVHGVSQVGFAFIWLCIGCLWVKWEEGHFLLNLMVLLSVCVLGASLLYVLSQEGFFLTVRVEREAILISFVAAFFGFPLAWFLGRNQLTVAYLKGPFKFPACFVLLGLTLYAGWGLTATASILAQENQALASKMEAAEIKVSQSGFASGANEIAALQEHIKAHAPSSEHLLYADGFWRRWSGVSNKNLTLDDALLIWQQEPQVRNKLLSWLCYHDALAGNSSAASVTFPLWLPHEKRWPCLAKQMAHWDEPAVLDALAHEMVSGEFQQGARLNGCRVEMVSDFPSQVMPGQTIDFELSVRPWLFSSSGMHSCPKTGRAELYIWGSRAKDVIPMSWFDDAEHQAYRQWHLPKYMKPGRYPLFVNLRQPPHWKRQRAIGLNSGRRGLFVKWVEVLPEPTIY